jgi:hypothetical protein
MDNNSQRTTISITIIAIVAAAAVLVMSAMVVTPWMSTTGIPEAYAVRDDCIKVGEFGECLKEHKLKKFKDKKDG